MLKLKFRKYAFLIQYLVCYIKSHIYMSRFTTKKNNPIYDYEKRMH